MDNIETYINKTQSILAKTANAHSKHAPVIVDKLIALGLLKQSSKQAAIDSLNSPELVFSTLNSLLDSSLASSSKPAVPSLGTSVKSAATSIPGKKESDRKFEEYFLRNIF